MAQTPSVNALDRLSAPLNTLDPERRVAAMLRLLADDVEPSVVEAESVQIVIDLDKDRCRGAGEPGRLALTATGGGLLLVLRQATQEMVSELVLELEREPTAGGSDKDPRLSSWLSAPE